MNKTTYFNLDAPAGECLMYRFISALMLLVLLSGCSSTGRLTPSPFLSIKEIKTTLIEVPEIGQRRDASLGDTLMQKHFSSTGDAFEIEAGTVGSVPQRSSCGTLWATFKFPKTTSVFVARDYTSDDPDLDEALICSEPLAGDAIVDAKSGVEIWNSPYALSPMVCKSKNDNAFYVVGQTVFSSDCFYGDLRLPIMNTLPSGSVSSVQKSFASDTQRKSELIYNGRVGDALRFIYREFYDDMARPSFTQEIQYDLGISTIVGFKSAKLEIFEATNTKISYQVISHFADF
jgi:hypothetical protein